MILDLFSGGGGASLGLEWATGRSPDIAINHSADAVKMHAENHPNTRHLCGNVWDYAPQQVTQGKPVELLHASPTCTHFSRAKGAPLDRKAACKIRSLAWVITRYAKEHNRPKIITAENVSQWVDWGPLTNEGKPNPLLRGQTFRRWVKALQREGYEVQWRNLKACDFGAPTTRERLFVVARCDGLPITWPTPTHGTAMWEKPYRTAAECMQWEIECPSIEGRSLSGPTLARIDRGLWKFVIGAADPYVVDASIPWLIHLSNGERQGQAPRLYNIREPLRTVVASGVKQGLCRAFIAKHYGGHGTPGVGVRRPLSTITTIDHHALVTAHGDPIWDVGMRALVPRELFRCQGFPDSYKIDMLNKTAQVRMVGNSVSPQPYEALVAANLQQKAMAA
jgi:DNA (cytosine-5)-methyltransferase 1